MALLVGSRFVHARPRPPRSALLLAATALLGIGFGLTVPVVNRLAAALFPGRVERRGPRAQRLARPGHGAGAAADRGVRRARRLVGSADHGRRAAGDAPHLQRAAAAAARAPRAAANEVRSKKFWLFCGFALGYGVVETLNGNWAILYMKGVLHAPASLAAIALTLFWAAATAGRVLFAAVDRWLPGPHHLPAAPLGDRPRLRRDRAGPGVVARSRRRQLRPGGARLLGVAAADDQPRPRRRAARGSRSPAYQVGYGLAAFGVEPLRSHAGLSMRALFGGASGVALLLAGLAVVLVGVRGLARKRDQPAASAATNRQGDAGQT